MQPLYICTGNHYSDNSVIWRRPVPTESAILLCFILLWIDWPLWDIVTLWFIPHTLHMVDNGRGWLRLHSSCGHHLLYVTVNKITYWRHMALMRIKSLKTRLFFRHFVQAKSKENLKAVHYWPFHRWPVVPHTKAIDAESVSMSWRHHGIPISLTFICMHN